MAYCDECGARCDNGTGPAAFPSCAQHGPRWRLGRNAPCAATLIEADGQVLLGRRARDPWAGCWEVPGGFVELGEHPADAAVREAREELGVDVTLTGLLGVYVTKTPRDWLQIVVYVATTDDRTPVADPAEVAEWRWFLPEDIPMDMAADHRRRIDDWLDGRAVPLPAGR